MSLVGLILVLAIVGFALFILFKYVPMIEPIKLLIGGVVALAVIIILLRFAGIDTGLGNVRL